MDVWWWLVVVLAQVTRGLCDSHDVTVIFDTLRPASRVADNFLGISTSLRGFLSNGNYSVTTANMMQAVSPCYLRVGGAETDNLAFKTLRNSTDHFLLTEQQWVNLNQFAADTGLHLIFSLSPDSQTQSQLLSYSDQQGYDITWQLAFMRKEDKNETNETASREVGQEVLNLRRFIDSFPRYQNTAVLGPDVELCENPKCLKSLEDFLQIANDAVDIVILQINTQEDLTSYKNTLDKLQKFSTEVQKTSFSRDTLPQRNKNSLNKSIWVAEADSADHRGGLKEAVSSALSLGLTSRLGYHTFLLHLPQLSQPSPGYWVALLYKALVGRAVLGTHVWPKNSSVTVFAACTAYEHSPALDTEWEYDPGAMTFWGVNTADENTHISLRAGSPLGEQAHLYTLTQDERRNDDLLLNGQRLRVVHGVLPRLSPRVRMLRRVSPTSVSVPARSVFFIVLPDAQVPACIVNTDVRLPDPLKKEDSSQISDIPMATTKTPYILHKLRMKSGNIHFENGGIFYDIEKKNGLAMGQSVQEKIETELNDASKLNLTKSNVGEESTSKKDDFNTSYFLTNIVATEQPKMNNNENNTMKLSYVISKKYDDFISEDVQLEKEPSVGSINEKKSFIETFHERNDSFNPLNDRSSMRNIETKNGSLEETGIKRFKRSDSYDYFEHSVPRDDETSPLYRRVNLLKQILNKMQQSKQYENEEQNQNFGDLAVSVETVPSRNKPHDSSRTRKKNNEYSVEKEQSRGSKIASKEQTPKVASNKEEDNINYLPGEFYEILGGLKIDSNVSLKDKDEIIESSDSKQKLPESRDNCNDNESKLTVTKKPKNNPQEDRRLVEQATENSRKYYLSKNYSSEQQLKTEKAESIGSKYPNNHEDAFFQTNSKEDETERTKQSDQYLEKFLQGLKKVETDYESIEKKFPAKRIKREINNQEEVDELDKNLMLTPKYEENYKKLDYSDEVEMRHFLEELTNEGEQLLQTIDEEYESNVANPSHVSGTGQFSSKEHTLDKNKGLFGDENITIAENKAEEPDFYLKNNIVIEKEVKPKIKYQYEDDQELKSTLLDENFNTLAKGKIEQKSQISTTITQATEVTTSETDIPPSSEPTVITKMTTMESVDDKNITKQSSGKSITETINNSDMFIGNINSEADKTTEGMPSNYKFENYNYLPHNHRENENNEFIKTIPSEISDIYEGISMELKQVESEKVTGNDKDQPLLKLLSTKILALDSTTETYSTEIKHVKVTDVTSGLASTVKPIIINKTLNIKKVEDNNQDVKIDLNQQQHIKIPDIQTQTATKNIPEFALNNTNMINETTEKMFDKKTKIDSESKIVNKILPPPVKATLTLPALSIPQVLTLNRNLSLPKRIDLFNNKLKEFNNKQKLSIPVFKARLSRNTTISDKYKERIEIIKQRLQKARERLLNLTIPKATLSITPNKMSKVKREINMKKDVLNSFLNDENKKQTKTQLEKMADPISKMDLKQQQGPLMINPSSGLYLIHRLARQVYDNSASDMSSIESTSDQSGDAESRAKPENPFTDVLTPYYFSAIKKWVVPLSNSTENILFNNKLFPVNLYGIVSDKWVQENIKSDSNTELNRQRRALRYPCVKDKFNDFEAEDESNKFLRSSNVETAKTASLKNSKTHSSIEPEKRILRGVLSQLYSGRSKRAINKDIEMNEMEMKALLTNEIVKDKPVSYVPDHENVFNSMLQKTLSKTMSNKTGIERMFELAKQYKETNPTSIEIFSTKNNKYKKKFSVENLNDKFEENTATEITDDKYIDSSSMASTQNQNCTSADLTPAAIQETTLKNGTGRQNLSTKSSLNTDSLMKDENSHSDEWSNFIEKIQEFFESIASTIKKEIN